MVLGNYVKIVLPVEVKVTTLVKEDKAIELAEEKFNEMPLYKKSRFKVIDVGAECKTVSKDQEVFISPRSFSMASIRRDEDKLYCYIRETDIIEIYE